MCMAMARHLSENKVYFTVNESKGPFKFRGVSYQIDLPERVHPGDMVVAMIDPSKKTAVYVRQISSSVHINPHNMPRMESQSWPAGFSKHKRSKRPKRTKRVKRNNRPK